MSGKRIVSLKELPPGAHWIILEEDSYYSNGGYPGQESKNPLLNYFAYDNEHLWEKDLKELTKQKNRTQEFMGMRVNPAKVEMDVKVSVY